MGAAIAATDDDDAITAAATNNDDDDDDDAVPVTPKIDVFAYGVLLWEIFADTGITFEVTESRELDLHLSQAEDGATVMRLLPLPDTKLLHSACSRSVKKLMRDCWALDAEQRPTFEHISLTLRLAMQYYDCGDDFESIHRRRSKASATTTTAASAALLQRRRSSTNTNNTSSMRSVLLKDTLMMDAADIAAYHERVDGGGGGGLSLIHI